MISWLALSMALGVFAYLAAWSRLPTRARGLTIWAFALSLPISGALILNSRGWPVEPVSYLVGIPDGELELYGASLVPDVAIYVMLGVGDGPRLFQLPWDAKTASDIQRAMESGGKVTGKKRPKGRADDDAPMEFHEEPQRPSPEKQPETPGFDYTWREEGE